MKTFTITAAIAALAATAIPGAASAQRGWQPIAQRQANLDRRIEQGIRSGRLTRPEARRINAEFNQLSRLEARYRSNGLTLRERNDLDRRYDALSARIRYEKNDRQDRRR
ncbi:hypothetical protein [Sphingomonas metalli]|nr:hypothetical protein [Sphingomonas metalli]